MQKDDRYAEREFETRIDAALRSYAEPPEMAGPRVAFARLRSHPDAAESRRPVWMRFWVPAACLVALLIAAAVWLTTGPHGSPMAHPQIAFAPIAPQPPAGVVSTRAEAPPPGGPGAAQRGREGRETARETRNEVRPAGRELPKLAVFPTPRPLSPEERALVVLATQVPPKAQQQLLEAEKHAGDPITIAALKIRPLDQGDQQETERNAQ